MSTSPDVPLRDEHHSIPQTTAWQRLTSHFWALPAMVTLISFAVGLGLPRLDALFPTQWRFIFPGGPDGARSVLSTIAGAMISVTGLVFSITMVVLQLASSQFTPRVLKEFLSDRAAQYTLGIFIGSFVYALTVLREVRGGFDGQTAFVPPMSVSLAYVLVLASMGQFLVFIHRVTSMIQVSEVVSRLGDRTTALVEKIFTEADSEVRRGDWRVSGDPQEVGLDGRHGHVVEVDEQALVSLAHEHDLRIELAVSPGEFLTQGQPLALVWGDGEDLCSQINAAVRLGADRSLRQDPDFGIRQLVDIADRALSSGVNDPTTAVQVVNELERILKAVAARRDPACHLADVDGVVRVHRPQPTLAGMLTLATEEIAHYGREDPRLRRRLDELLADVRRTALPPHRATVERQQQVVRGQWPGQ